MKMNKLFTTVLLLMATSTVLAQKLSTIQGKWIEPSTKILKLYEVVNGDQVELASTAVTKAGQFAFSFYPPKEAYYVIGSNPKAEVYRYIFYLKPGDNLNFQIEGDNWALTGVNTPENKEIERWHKLVQPLESMSIYFSRNISTYEDFFPLLNSKLLQIKAMPSAKTPNKEFNASFESFKQFNLIDIAQMLLYTPRSKHPQSEDMIPFYRDTKISDFTKSLRLLNYPNGIEMIEKGYVMNLKCEKSLSNDAFSSKLNDAKNYLLNTPGVVVNNVVKGELVLSMAARCKTYPGVMDFKEKYEKYLANEDQKTRFRQIVGKLDDNSKGHAAIDFKFRDSNNKEIALSDFKGKVVFIDVWATWCGPCNREIPFMTKLEEEYKDNSNIVFMSVSVDAEKDFQKWKDFIVAKGMKGIQLFAGEKEDDIMGPYKILGIPRFILVGKDGNIITADSPRPSSDEIRPLLNSALK